MLMLMIMTPPSQRVDVGRGESTTYLCSFTGKKVDVCSGRASSGRRGHRRGITVDGKHLAFVWSDPGQGLMWHDKEEVAGPVVEMIRSSRPSLQSVRRERETTLREI